jgi:hypothetical protein
MNISPAKESKRIAGKIRLFLRSATLPLALISCATLHDRSGLQDAKNSLS